MREVNEVVQKVYGGEKPVPLWLDDGDDSVSSIKRILFSLNIRVKRIQLTATTPCNSAVRFETGALDLHLSNRVKNIAEGPNTKLFGKAQIDFNLSLGQIIRNVIFDEAEPEFQQYAFFNTTIGLRNAFQDEMLNDDKELVLITLKRPLIYIQPVAVDKAILVWLNYKNAYEYWAEKRANLNKEVLTATQQVFEKMPFGQFSQHLSGNHLSTVFLQLTVDDMGICLPLNPLPFVSSFAVSFKVSVIVGMLFFCPIHSQPGHRDRIQNMNHEVLSLSRWKTQSYQVIVHNCKLDFHSKIILLVAQLAIRALWCPRESSSVCVYDLLMTLKQH